MVIIMAPTKRIRIIDLNDSMTCPLCKGYLIDAATITECLHSFCRSCLVEFLVTNKFCPVCDVQIHKTKPLMNIRSDKMLQDFVYKLVPGLYQNEMLRRRNFYESNKNLDKPNDPERMGVINKYSKFISADERLSISLEFLSGDTGTNSCLSRIAAGPLKSFLSCPAIFVIRLLKKWLLTKFALDLDRFQIDMFYDQHLLYDDLTLMDVAYLYVWQGNSPMNLTFKIYEKLPKIIPKKEEKLSPPSSPLKNNKALTKLEEIEENSNEELVKVEVIIDEVENTSILSNDIKSEETKPIIDTPKTSKVSSSVSQTGPTTTDSLKSDNLPKIPDLIDIKTRKKTKDEPGTPTSSTPPIDPPTVSVVTISNTNKSEVPLIESIKISPSIKVTPATTIPVLSIPSPPSKTSPIQISQKPSTVKATATVTSIKPRDELIIVPISKPNSTDTGTVTTTSETITVTASTTSVSVTKTTDSSSNVTSVEIRRHKLPQSVQLSQHLAGSKRPIAILGKMADSTIPPHKNLKLNSGGTRPAILSRKVPIYSSAKFIAPAPVRNHKSPFSIASLTSSGTSNQRPTISLNSMHPLQHHPYHHRHHYPPPRPSSFDFQELLEINRKQSNFYDSLKISTQACPIKLPHLAITTTTSVVTSLPVTTTKTDHRPYISVSPSPKPTVTCSNTPAQSTTTITTAVVNSEGTSSPKKAEVKVTPPVVITTPTTTNENITPTQTEIQEKSVPTTTSDVTTVPKNE